MHHSSHNWQISKKIGGINIVLDLPESGIALAAKNRQGKCQNHQVNVSWRPAAKQNPPRIESQ